jgi:DNA-directed RNA polymerase specialized sigma24 family protein
MQSNSVDETEIALLLMEGGAQRAEGLRKLDEAYRACVAAHLRARFPSMRSDDIADCYTDVLIQLIEALRAYDRDPVESTFDPNQPLLPYILTVAYRRGVDRLRRVRLHDEFVHAVGRALAETDLGRYWSDLSPVERQEIQAQACKAIAQLPPKERFVWGIFVDRCKTARGIPSSRSSVR